MMTQMVMLQDRGPCCPPRVTSAADNLVQGAVDSCCHCRFLKAKFHQSCRSKTWSQTCVTCASGSQTSRKHVANPFEDSVADVTNDVCDLTCIDVTGWVESVLDYRDADETFMAETETRPETFSLETETRPRHW